MRLAELPDEVRAARREAARQQTWLDERLQPGIDGHLGSARPTAYAGSPRGPVASAAATFGLCEAGSITANGADRRKGAGAKKARFAAGR
jgi:hypothetical protein